MMRFTQRCRFCDGLLPISRACARFECDMCESFSFVRQSYAFVRVQGLGRATSRTPLLFSFHPARGNFPLFKFSPRHALRCWLEGWYNWRKKRTSRGKRRCGAARMIHVLLVMLAPVPSAGCWWCYYSAFGTGAHAVGHGLIQVTSAVWPMTSPNINCLALTCHSQPTT